jgi:hypothetical protein
MADGSVLLDALIVENFHHDGDSPACQGMT